MADKWSVEEEKILREHLDAFRACTGATRSTARTKILHEVYNQISKWKGDLTAGQKKMLKSNIQDWYCTYGRTRQSRDRIRMHHAHNYRTVIGAKNKPMIDDCLVSRGLGRGTQEYLADYQREITKIIQGLSEEEIEKAKKEAKVWNEQGPPLEIQAKNARTKAHKYIGQFSHQMYKQLGMYGLLVTHHRTEEGNIQYLVHDFGREVCGLSMEEASPDWEANPILDGLAKHAKALYDTNETTEAQTLQRGVKKAPLVKIQLDERGFPMLPTYEKNRPLPCLPGFAAGKRVKSAPWGLIAQKQQEFIDQEYLNNNDAITLKANSTADLPDDQYVILKEPSKMNDPAIRKLVAHWYLRQKEDEYPFRFKAFYDKGVFHSAVDKPAQQSSKSAPQTKASAGSSRETPGPRQQPTPASSPKEGKGKTQDSSKPSETTGLSLPSKPASPLTDDRSHQQTPEPPEGVTSFWATPAGFGTPKSNGNTEATGLPERRRSLHNRKDQEKPAAGTGQKVSFSEKVNVKIVSPRRTRTQDPAPEPISGLSDKGQMRQAPTRNSRSKSAQARCNTTLTQQAQEKPKPRPRGKESRIMTEDEEIQMVQQRTANLEKLQRANKVASGK